MAVTLMRNFINIAAISVSLRRRYFAARATGNASWLEILYFGVMVSAAWKIVVVAVDVRQPYVHDH